MQTLVDKNNGKVSGPDAKKRLGENASHQGVTAILAGWPSRLAAPSKRKTEAPADAVADRALVANPADPRQAGLFDESLPKWIRPCLRTLVAKPPLGDPS